MTEFATEAMREHDIDLPAGRFHYLSWGAERTELPAALLIHGITRPARSWVRVGPALADRYRVYAFDMRGHGDSVHPAPGAYSLRQTADDAAAFIAALGLERPLLIGHSWGGATALVLASGAGLDQPAPAFAQVILEDPAYNFGEGDPEKRAAFYVQDIGRSPEKLLSELILSSPGWTAADIEGKIDALQKVTREAVISVFADTARDGDVLPLLSRIPAPVLFIRADADLGSIIDAPNWIRANHLLPAHSKAVEIIGSTHNVHRSKFSEFMRAVDTWLQEQSTRQ